MSTILRAEPLFARWAIAEGVSMAGTAVSFVVLPVLVYDLTGSAGLTGCSSRRASCRIYCSGLSPHRSPTGGTEGG